ncbi:Gfo/Idh/MocA family oxidoreductase [Hamadaea tsunoensis]|uniref:oxidoreductase n=1 Tax=Hamadaea tsunoensis TaxID=53368 RepID=UPI00041C1846|nr:oxidoreductase [Hamadaea tsunoensis]
MASDPIRYAVIGRGWRAQFFFKLAAVLPERFTVTSVLTRSPDAGVDRPIPVVHDVESAVRTGSPEFVITSVPWDTNPGLVKTLAAQGVRVLSETPPAPDRDGLADLLRAENAELVQVAEQYLMLPDHAARLAVLQAGAIGERTSAQVSSTHGYHAVSMLRGFLGVGRTPATVRATAFTAPLADPLDRDGWRDDLTPRPAVTTLATLDFGGRAGLYDFTDGQWWNPLRSRRVVVRGSAGELADDTVVRMADPRTPVQSSFRRRQLGRDLNLEGFDLDHISYDGTVVWRNPFAGARLSDEEIAIATLLSRMGDWCRGVGEAPYPLAEACHDHLLSLAIDEAARSGEPVAVQPL